MEFAVSIKPSLSNMSDGVSTFSKTCKFRSLGVFDTAENTDHGQVYQYQIISGGKGTMLVEQKCGNDWSDAAVGALHNVEKKGDVCGHVEILKLFDTLLALKLAYMKMQEAHIPYDPEKIRAADEEVVSQFDSLCKINKAYKEKLLKKASSDSARSAVLLSEIKIKERAVDKLKSQAKQKDREIANLRQALQELEVRNKKLAEEIGEKERESFKSLSHCSLENVMKAVGKAIHDFAKPVIALMKLSDWNLDKAADAIQTSVVYAKRSHKKYAFEAYIARRMFHRFTPQTCFVESIMKLDDPIVALMEEPHSGFAKFCRKKYLSVVHPQMEVSFFGNLDHRTFVVNGIHPHTPFYGAFVRMARWVWYLQGVAAFIEPEAEIFGVKQGSEFSDVFMEVLKELKEFTTTLDSGKERCKVEFMVMPGFKFGEALIKSQVYISVGRSSSS